MYEPTVARLIIVKSRISPESWEARVEAARKAEKIIQELEELVEQGHSLNEAIRRRLPEEKRSWAIRRWDVYQKQGFEGLIDKRTPKTPKFSRRCLDIIQSARLANPKVTVDEVLAILSDRQVNRLPSEATIKREFRKADDRRRYAEKKK